MKKKMKVTKHEENKVTKTYMLKPQMAETVDSLSKNGCLLTLHQLAIAIFYPTGLTEKSNRVDKP